MQEAHGARDRRVEPGREHAHAYEDREQAGAEVADELPAHGRRRLAVDEPRDRAAVDRERVEQRGERVPLRARHSEHDGRCESRYEVPGQTQVRLPFAEHRDVELEVAQVARAYRRTQIERHQWRVRRYIERRGQQARAS